jgi:hypothetical protein
VASSSSSRSSRSRSSSRTPSSTSSLSWSQHVCFLFFISVVPELERLAIFVLGENLLTSTLFLFVP